MVTSKLFSQFRVLYNLMVLRKNKVQLNNIRNLTNYAFRNSNLTPDFFEKLCLSVGQEKLNTSLGIRKQYGTDESSHESLPPDIVANPDCVDDICKVTKLCSEYCVPIIPHGSGTGVEQGIAAVMGGVSVDLALLNSIIELNVGDFDCTVEAGITRKTLNSHLKNTGLMFPILPLMHQLEEWYPHQPQVPMLSVMVQ